MVDLVKQNYADKLERNLPIYNLEISNLKKFCTDKKLAKSGISRMPWLKFRNFEEDLLKFDMGLFFDSEEDLINGG